MLCFTHLSGLMLTVQQTRKNYGLFILLLVVVVDISLIRKIQSLSDL